MKPWKMCCTGLLLAAGFAPAAFAQGLPAITPPPGLAIAPQPPPVNAPAPPAALPPNIWDKLCPRADQKAACKAKICNSPIGQLFNNMLRPVGALTGGIMGPCCPTINAADLAKPPDSAEGAAARLKLDEADAAARREAIRYMAGADCHYWPEVTDALIGALRADRNECVRLEAALALGRGCCCSRATMKALTLSVSGSQEDGNPPEDSERVKAAALTALNHCLACYTEVVPAPEPIPVKPIEPGPGKEPVPPKGAEPVPPPVPNAAGTPDRAPGIPNTLPGALNKPAGATEFYHNPENLEEKKVVAEARRAAEHVNPVVPQMPSPAADHTLFGIVRSAMLVEQGPVVPAAMVMEKPAAQGGVFQATMTQKPAAQGTVVPATAVEKPAAQGAVVQAMTQKPAAQGTVVPATAVEKPAAQNPAPVAPRSASAVTPPQAAAPKPAAVAAPAPAPAAPAAPPSGIAPVSYLPPAGTTTAQASAAFVRTSANPPAATLPKSDVAMNAPARQSLISAAGVVNFISVLHESINPTERERAADALASCDGWSNPNAVRALVEGARSDAAPLVRAACLRSLTRMNVRTLPVVTVAQALKTDPDPRVRTEAEQALKQLDGGTARAQ